VDVEIDLNAVGAVRSTMADMNLGRTVFSQLMDLLPHREFRRCVARYQGDFNVQTFSCLDQFLCMAFAQLSYRESLGDIQACLRAVGPRLYHRGFRGTVSRNTLAHANERRDWRIYADFAQILIGQARALYAHEPFAANLDQIVYALDSTTIDLCLALFPWAPLQRSKAAVKLHTLLDLHGNIPTVVHITHGRISDVSQLDRLLFGAGSFLHLGSWLRSFSASLSVPFGRVLLCHPRTQEHAIPPPLLPHGR
jgi:hypothetical protein